MFPEVAPEAQPPRDPAEVEAELNAFRHATGDKVLAGIEATGKVVDYDVNPSQASIDQGYGDEAQQKLVGPAAARAALQANRPTNRPAQD